MKKSTKILLNACIVIIFLCSLLVMSFLIKDLINYVKMRDFANKEISVLNLFEGSISNEDYTRHNILNLYNSKIQSFNKLITFNAIYLTLTAIAAAASVFVFIYCNPKLFRRSVYDDFAEGWAKNKAERAEQKKQRKIQELESKLEELKKDE